MIELTLQRLPVKKNVGMFLMYEGEKKIKAVGEQYKVTPISLLEANGVLFDKLSYSIRNGFKTGRSYLVPYQQGNFGEYVKGREPIRVEMKSWLFIDAYKLVRVLELLPEVNVEDVRLFNNIKKMIGGYQREGEKFLEPFEKKRSLMNRALKRIPIGSNIPKPLSNVSLEELKKALDSEPPFLNGAGRDERIDVMLPGDVKDIKIL